MRCPKCEKCYNTKAKRHIDKFGVCAKCSGKKVPNPMGTNNYTKKGIEFE